MAKWILLSALAVSFSFVSAEDLPARLEKVIKAHSIGKANLGISVVDLTRAPQNEVFALNEQNEMMPASITKLATASAVLQRLGSSFKFQTGLWSAASVKGSTLKGDLVLKGGGDPGFVSETMWFLVNEFVRTGIKTVDGDIVVDDSDFDGVRTDSSREPERVDRAYDAPVGAMSFNWNSVTIYIRPGDVGAPPSVFIDPIGDLFTIDNKAKTVKGAGNGLEVSRNGKRIVIRGSIGASLVEIPVYKNIDDPARWSGENLVFFLQQRGIKVTGKVKDGRKSSSARLLAKADSKPLGQHIADMLKFSNNYVAEMLTKDLASNAGQNPATLARGMKMIREYLVEIGIAADRFTLENPSGLSRNNKVRAHDMTALLVHVQKQFPMFAEMLSALPFAGIDGTLKKRMKGTLAEGWVRAKTGNLSGVISLAGYAGNRDGSVRAFTFMYNGKSDAGDSARKLFDDLAEELVQ